MKFIFLILVTVVQLALQLVSGFAVNSTFIKEEPSSLIIEEKTKKSIPQKGIEPYSKQNEK